MLRYERMTTIDAAELARVSGGALHQYKYALDRRRWSAKTCFKHAGKVADDYNLKMHNTRDPRQKDFIDHHGNDAGSAYMSGGCHIYVD